MGKDREPGEISLTGIFSAVANEMMGAVVRGKMLHRTKNIRDSGAPFESTVREKLSALLPRAFSVNHGYLFDTNGACTPQLDAFLCSTMHAQAIFGTPEGAVYTPFSDTWAIGEIKASSASMETHLSQVSDRIQAVKKMRLALQKEGASFPNLTSFLIVGDCQSSSDNQIKEHWAKRSGDFPDFILLLGAGELILPPSSHGHLFEWDCSKISPIDQRGPTVSVLSSEDDELDVKMGKVLSWFFFAILHRLRLAESHDLKIAWSSISRDDGIREAMIPDKIAGLLSKAADPFSLAITRQMKLNCIRKL